MERTVRAIFAASLKAGTTTAMRWPGNMSGQKGSTRSLGFLGRGGGGARRWVSRAGSAGRPAVGRWASWAVVAAGAGAVGAGIPPPLVGVTAAALAGSLAGSLGASLA